MMKMSKRMAALLLALAVFFGAAAAEGADTAVKELPETAETTETAAPVVLATVNGEEITDQNADVQEVLEYYADYAAADPSMEVYIRALGMNYAVSRAIYMQKINEQLTDERKAALEAEAKASWAEIIDEYAHSLAGLTEDSTEEEIQEARTSAAGFIEMMYGYTEDSYVQANVMDQVLLELIGDVNPTEEEVTEYFNAIVEENKQLSETNPSEYAKMAENGYDGDGNRILYFPEGGRGITHILLDTDDALISNYVNLLARLEEQDETEITEATETESAGEAEAPVTREQVDEALKAIFDSVKEKTDDIKARYEAGTSFEDLIAEYGTDPGMQEETYLKNGYTLFPNGGSFVPEFTEAAFDLAKVGDISEPILMSSYGVTILRYVRDIPAGAAELTEEIRAELADALAQQREQEIYNELMEKWESEAEIVYTEAGQALLDAVSKLPAGDAQGEATEESVTATEATEEALADGQ